VILLVMGVSGSGKTTLGHRVADELGWAFLDADWLHSEANIAKMRSGAPLTEDDRAPWLAAVAAAIREADEARRQLVVACSALRASHRALILEDVRASFVVHLALAEDELQRRLRERRHFMPVDLLASQLETLEPPTDALLLDSSAPLQELVARVVAALAQASSEG
jgi:gluconokinase